MNMIEYKVRVLLKETRNSINSSTLLIDIDENQDIEVWLHKHIRNMMKFTILEISPIDEELDE